MTKKRMEIIRARLEMVPEKPNGKAWLASYHTDVSLLLQELKRAEMFSLPADKWESRWL